MKLTGPPATAGSLPSRVDNFACIDSVRQFAATIEWPKDCTHKLDVVALQLLGAATTGSAQRREPSARQEASLVVGYIRGSCSLELGRQRYQLERAGCERIFRDMQPMEGRGWAGLVRALDILREGDTLIAGPRTLTTLLSEHGHHGDDR